MNRIVADRNSNFYGRPLAWLGFALALLVVPVIGYMLQAEMAWEEIHPAINALLNGTSAIFLGMGWLAIRGRREDTHRACMLAAFFTSTVFLISYLARFAMSGTHRYPGTGWDKSLYLAILFTHMILAMVLVPLVLRSLYLALRDRRGQHRKIARITWPIWMFVSVSGVVVYLMLYPIANALYGS